MRSFASPELRHNIVEWGGGFRRRPPGHLYEKGPTMGERRRRRMMMAYHEAAHAVLARRQGLACTEIRMSGSVGALTASASYESGEAVEAKIAGYEIDAAVALAGPVANVRFSGRPSSFSDGAESDLQIAQAAAGSIALLKSGQSLPGAGNEELELPRDVLRQAERHTGRHLAEL